MRGINLHVTVSTEELLTYDSAIAALKMHAAADGHTIKLDASTFRKLAEDQWDWTEDFLTSNSQYSETAAIMHLRTS